MKKDRTGLLARAEMEQAKEKSEKKFSNNAMPRRYNLYAKIKEHVSLRTIDTIIILTSVLIIVLLVVGIVTGNPPQ